MAPRARPKRERLSDALARARPELAGDAAAVAALVADGRVLVDGRPVLNPAAMVPLGSALTVRPEPPLRGEAKLRFALDTFGIDVSGRVALDAGAAAGGFTTVLLERGARRVYAVDVGHGQLRGRLSADDRVVSLERTNVGDLEPRLVPDTIDVVTLDLSYLALGPAVRQLDRVTVSPEADLVALVKPMFELALAEPPSDPEQLAAALAVARDGITAAGWTVVARCPEPGHRLPRRPRIPRPRPRRGGHTPQALTPRQRTGVNTA